MKKAILIIVIILLVGVFAYSAWNVVGTLLEYRKGEAFYEDLNQYVSTPEEAVKPKKPAREPLLFKATEPTTPPETQPQEGYPELEVDFDALLELNQDVVAQALVQAVDGQAPGFLTFEVADCDPYLIADVTMENTDTP